MKRIFTLFLAFGFFSPGILCAQKNQPVPVMDDCDKVQALLTHLYEFKGALINDNAYECKSAYVLNDFIGARVIVPGKEGKYWTVNMNTDALQKIEAESKYMLLVQQLMKCVYLNSWKGKEDIVGDGIYHFNFKQTISNNGYYKNILVSYRQLKPAELYKVEITLTN